MTSCMYSFFDIKCWAKIWEEMSVREKQRLFGCLGCSASGMSGARSHWDLQCSPQECAARFWNVHGVHPCGRGSRGSETRVPRRPVLIASCLIRYWLVEWVGFLEVSGYYNTAWRGKISAQVICVVASAACDVWVTQALRDEHWYASRCLLSWGVVTHGLSGCRAGTLFHLFGFSKECFCSQHHNLGYNKNTEDQYSASIWSYWKHVYIVCGRAFGVLSNAVKSLCLILWQHFTISFIWYVRPFTFHDSSGNGSNYGMLGFIIPKIGDCLIVWSCGRCTLFHTHAKPSK